MSAEKRLAAAALAVAAFTIPAITERARAGSSQGAETLNLGGTELAVHAPYRPLLELAGVDGPSFRFDGNSTWAESEDPVELSLEGGLTVSAWVALASPPVEIASVVHLAGAGGEMRLAVGPWREPEFRLGELRAATFEPLEPGRWVHLAGTFDGETARLYIDGKLAGESETQEDTAVPETLSGTLAVGRSLDGGMRYEAHQLGVWNGLIGGLELRTGAASVPEPVTPPADAPIGVPQQWFAEEPHRPAFHPLPSAGWTNEPHTLTWDNGAWHLYHQANPSGAFWEFIVWGHLVSRDLVNWETRLPALMPGTGFDRRGIWVGNRIPETGPPAILYTGVDGARSGLGRAVRRADGGFDRDEGVIAHDTPPGYQDMRDPWVVKTDAGWLALIGSGTPAHDAPLILAWTSEDSVEWGFAGEFDTGETEMPGEFWELPVLKPIDGRWMLMGTPVIADAPARTYYWIGDFDGARFVPDDLEPRQYDLFGTLLAPTLATDDAGRMIAIGVIPDDGQRPEEVRRAAGWVHALSLPVELTLCADAPERLCQALAPELETAFPSRFALPVDADLRAGEVSVDLGHDPVRVDARFTIPEGGEVGIDLRATPDRSEATQLVLRSSRGEVVLDNTRGSRASWARDDRIVQRVPAQEEVEVSLIIDRAAISGTINGQVLGVMVYPESVEATMLHVRTGGGARIEDLAISVRD
jgi:sucrose-6-phosphate hydrolase SacC (GH32 family)